MHPKVEPDTNSSAEKSSGCRGRKAAGRDKAPKAVRKETLNTQAARGRDQNLEEKHHGASSCPGGRCPGNRQTNLDAWRTLVCPLKLVVRFQYLSQTGKLRLKLWIKCPLKSSKKNRFLFINKYQSGLTFLSQQEILENNVAETPE